MAHEARDYLAAGMDGVVAKPVDLAVLLMAIERALMFASPGLPSRDLGKAHIVGEVWQGGRGGLTSAWPRH